MAGRRVHFVMPSDLVERIDAALSDGVSRGEFVRRAVERALSGSPDGATPSAERVPGTLPREARSVAPAEQLSRHAPNCKCPVCSWAG